MNKHRSTTIFSVPMAGLAVLIGVPGCESNESIVSTTPSAQIEDERSTHAHPTAGPHDGPLIELGQEAYHAELVHDETTDAVAIYVLDSSAERAEPIDAPQLQINVSGIGEAKQFSLTADPDLNDPEGKSSRFTSSDAELTELLDQHAIEAQLVVSIAGKQYRGTIAHGHEDH